MLTTVSGRPILGTPTEINPETKRAIRTADATQLPWTLSVTGSQLCSLDYAQTLRRRQMLVAGLAMMLILLGGSTDFALRGVRRELAAARLQTDFVAAVSHEFRTPLTSLRHVTELLEETDDMPAERRKSFYEAIARNTDRLHRAGGVPAGFRPHGGEGAVICAHRSR